MKDTSVAPGLPPTSKAGDGVRVGKTHTHTETRTHTYTPTHTTRVEHTGEQQMCSAKAGRDMPAFSAQHLDEGGYSAKGDQGQAHFSVLA